MEKKPNRKSSERPPLPSVLGHALVPFVLVVPDDRHPVRDLLPEPSHLGPLDRKRLAQEAEPVHPLGLDGDILWRVVQDLVGGRAGPFLEREGFPDGEVEACKILNRTRTSGQNWSKTQNE